MQIINKISWSSDSDDIIKYTDSIKKNAKEIHEFSSIEKSENKHQLSFLEKSKSSTNQESNVKDHSYPKDSNYQTFGKSDNIKNADETQHYSNNILKGTDNWLKYETEEVDPFTISDSPVLFLDVNFGNGNITRIVMYENDTPEELAEAFWLEHKLDEEKKTKLVGIIKQHLDTVLDQITEQSYEE